MTGTQKLVALVTGGNKGIGRAAVEGLARRGMTVLLGAREGARGRKAAEELAQAGDVRFVQLDVTDRESVERAAAAAAAPGFVATDLNDHRGTRTLAQGAAVIIRLATLDADGPTGGFFDDQGPVAW